MKHKILLGLTGSVATVLYDKLIEEFMEIGEVSVVLTERAEHFVSEGLNGARVFRDKDEWTWYRSTMVERPGFPNITQNYTHKWQKDDEVLHIKLRDSYSALVIAPCSANTLAKLSNGLCDNLLTTVARAWDRNRPFVIAPAMNTYMWEHPLTQKQIDTFLSFSDNNLCVNPIEKRLACGTFGLGALANVKDIVNMTKSLLTWNFPLEEGCCHGIPTCGHPGSFACKRKNSTHTGVDLYTTDGARVHAVEDGKVVDIEHFTGEWDGSPWWNNTDCVLVEGPTGVVCYGEVSIPHHIQVGMNVYRGQWIANVKRVLKEGKERPDIMGHSTSMLHMELYQHGIVKSSNGFDPNLLHDPTPFLLNSSGKPDKLFTV